MARLESDPIRGGSKDARRLTARLRGGSSIRAVLAFCVVAAAVVVAMLGGGVASAKVFTSQNQALREAFPDATRIERDSRIILSADRERIEAIIKEEPPSRVVVLHAAWKGDELLGYAHIDVHTVRTKPEAFMIVLTPEGVVRSVRVLAFHEPLDYLPTDRWYGQFGGKTREDRLRVGADVHGVVGATLSARAAAQGVRRMLAYWEVLLRPEQAAMVADEAAESESEDELAEAQPEIAAETGKATP